MEFLLIRFFPFQMIALISEPALFVETQLRVCTMVSFRVRDAKAFSNVVFATSGFTDAAETKIVSCHASNETDASTADYLSVSKWA